jgi:WD40 repeat protein
LPDDKHIISGSYDATVRVWDAVSGDCQNTLTGHTSSVTSVAFSPDGKQIVSGSWNGTVRVWDAVSGECQNTLTGHTSSVTSVAFSPDGKQIVSEFWDGTAQVWDSSTGTLQPLIENSREENSLPLAFSWFPSATGVSIVFCCPQLAAHPFPSR